MLRIHLEFPTPRARYIVEHVVKHMLGWDIIFVDTLEELRSSEGPRLVYGGSASQVANGFHVLSSGWLEQKGTAPFQPPTGKEGDLLTLFPTAQGFDLFAGAFYLLSRYEEYTGNSLDQHGRLTSAAHFVVKHGTEQLPVIDLWALQFALELRQRFPELPDPTRTYAHTVTVDVDNGLKYLGRPYWKQGGAALRDLVKGGRSLAAERIAVLRGDRKDPFSVYERLVETARDGSVERLIAFILVQGEGRYDHAADIDHPQMVHAIQQLAHGAEVGIHPSYKSSEQEALIRSELARLAHIAGKSVHNSRQHFLRWRMPQTLRALEQAGITEDHSLGFSDRSGFRAGTCTPFRWYDLQEERVSDMVLHPFSVMDSALHDRMGLRPKEATQEIMRMSDTVRSVGGQFISVWHDRFLSGHSQWAGWPEAFQQVIRSAAP